MSAVYYEIGETHRFVHERFELADPIAQDMVECQPTKGGAFDLARRLAKRRGNAIDVYDRMARRLQPCEWTVHPDGHIATTGYKSQSGATVPTREDLSDSAKARS